jgi:hypothetical protein
MVDKFVPLLILIAVTALPCALYLLAWRSKNLKTRRVFSGIIAVVFALGAAVGTFGYLLPAFSHPNYGQTDSLAVLVLTGICAGAWILTIRFAIFTFPKKSNN